jgi:hypothetical protein
MGKEGKNVLESLGGFDLFSQTEHVDSHSSTLPMSESCLPIVGSLSLLH